MTARWTVIHELEGDDWAHVKRADDGLWRHDYMTRGTDSALLLVASSHDAGGWALNEWSWSMARRMASEFNRALSVRLLQTRFDVLLTEVQMAYVLRGKTPCDAASPYYKLSASIT